MWYVYVLKSNNSDFIYVGSTHDLKRRLAEHNEGSSVSTKSYRPFKLVALERILSSAPFLPLGTGSHLVHSDFFQFLILIRGQCAF